MVDFCPFPFKQRSHFDAKVSQGAQPEGILVGLLGTPRRENGAPSVLKVATGFFFRSSQGQSVTFWQCVHLALNVLLSITLTYKRPARNIQTYIMWVASLKIPV